MSWIELLTCRHRDLPKGIGHTSRASELTPLHALAKHGRSRLLRKLLLAKHACKHKTVSLIALRTPHGGANPSKTPDNACMEAYPISEMQRMSSVAERDLSLLRSIFTGALAPSTNKTVCTELACLPIRLRNSLTAFTHALTDRCR